MKGKEQLPCIGSIVARLRAGVSPVCDQVPPSPGEFGVLTLTAVTSGTMDGRHAKRIAAERVQPNWPVVKAGTVLVTRGSGSRDLVGACVFVENDEPRLILPDTIWILELANGYSAQFLVEFLRSERGRKAIHQIARGSNGVWKISQRSFLAIPLPPVTPQIVVAVDRVTGLFDQTHQRLAKLLDAKRKLKRSFMQLLLTGRRRFPEYENRPWQLRQFGQLCEELNARNGDEHAPENLMGVIKGVGFEPMRERVRGKGNLARCKVVPASAFAYNPMRLNIGSIAYNDLGKTVLVSPDYVVFRARAGVAEPGYINQLRLSANWSSFMDHAGAGSVRVRIYFSDLMRLQVPAPASDEQLRIVEVLSLLDRELDQLQRLDDMIHLQKRGLVTRLLSGESAVPK